MPMGPSHEGAAAPSKVPLAKASERSVSGGLIGGQGRWAVLFGAFCGALLAAAAISLEESVGSGTGWLPRMGLLFPLSVVAAGAAWVSIHLLLDPRLPAASSLLQPRERRARLVILAPLTVGALIVAAVLSRGLLGAFAERPSQGGVLATLVTLGVLTFVAYAADALAPWVARSLGDLRPAGALLVFGSFVTLSVGGLVAWGDPSGGRGGLLLFGVLRRDELNLLPVLQSGLILAASLALGGWCHVRQRSGKKIKGLLALLSLGLVCLSGFGFASALSMSPRDAVTVERTRGLAAPVFAAMARWADRDGDGVPAALGGGDCDDGNAAIGPGAVDVPGNGVDEDCSGADAVPAAPQGEVEPEAAPHGAGGTVWPPDANVLLLTVDTLRYDLGYARESNPGKLSPRLDELAQRSTVFRRAYSLASYTSKSLGPMLLGLYPSEAPRTFEHFDRFDPSVPFVQQRLQAVSIRTVSAQAYWYFFMDGYGLNRGWDVLDHSAAPRAISVDGDSHVSGDALAEATIRELGKLDDEGGRFFFWTHWVDPHSEYVRHADFDFGGTSRERYDSEVAFVDAAIGRVLDALSVRSFAGRTVVIVTSDHGEAFGEHGMIRHGFELWEELVRVPLIVHVPGARPHVVDAPRSLIDVTTTLLDVYGVKAGGTQGPVRGTSLGADVALGANDLPARRPVLIDMPQGPHNQERRAFLSGDRKLVTSAGRVIGLYDLAIDPEERHDLSSDAAQVESMRSEMSGFVSQLHTVPARR